MRPYLAILKKRFFLLFQYRFAAMAGLCTQVFWGIIKVMILTAFYEQVSSDQPISLLQTKTFIWIGQAFFLLLPWGIDKEIEMQVRNGNVVYELVKPIDLYGSWFFRALAMRLVPSFLRALPLFLIAGLFFNLSAPISLAALLSFGISVLVAIFLSSAITTMVMISLFWTVSGDGILRLLPSAVLLLSGMIVPLPLFPDWLKPFLYFQPFRAILDIPCRLYTGMIPSSESIYYIGFQICWLFVFIFIGRYLMKKGIKRLVVQGG